MCLWKTLSDKGITHGVLLVEVAADGARLLVPPCSPFVDKQADALLRVFLIHYLAVLVDDLFYFQTLAHGPIEVIVVELRG